MKFKTCNFKLVFCCTACFILLGCTKEMNTILKIPKGIYVGGSKQINTFGHQKAVYWNDGKETTLFDKEYYAGINSIYVKDSIIYSVGSEGHGPDNRAVYWLNNSTYFLTDYHPSPRTSGAKSIFISSVDVYVAGFDTDYNWTGNIVSRARFWKNGEPTDLSENNWWLPNISSTTANSIVVRDSNVYVCGSAGNFARYWINTKSVNLTDGLYPAAANVIAADGNNIYVAGWESNGSKKVAKLWINGISTIQTDGINDASFTSIFVENNDVYLAGYEYEGSNQVAKYWKNENAYSLANSDHYSNATGIALKDNNVWVSGYEIVNSIVEARLWENGIIVDFFPKDSFQFRANCLFIAK